MNCLVDHFSGHFCGSGAWRWRPRSLTPLQSSDWSSVSPARGNSWQHHVASDFECVHTESGLRMDPWVRRLTITLQFFELMNEFFLNVPQCFLLQGTTTVHYCLLFWVLLNWAINWQTVAPNNFWNDKSLSSLCLDSERQAARLMLHNVRDRRGQWDETRE